MQCSVICNRKCAYPVCDIIVFVEKHDSISSDWLLGLPFVTYCWTSKVFVQLHGLEETKFLIFHVL